MFSSFILSNHGIPFSLQGGSAQGVDRVMAADIAAQAALKRLHKEEPKVSYGQKKIQMIVSRIKFAGLYCLLFIWWFKLEYVATI